MTVAEIASKAKVASLKLARLSTQEKNAALEKMAEVLESNESSILSANEKDLEYARRENIPGPLIARLALDSAKVQSMAKGIRRVSRLVDPVGRVKSVTELDEGLTLSHVTCPIGVIGAIFESRPDAVPQNFCALSEIWKRGYFEGRDRGSESPIRSSYRFWQKPLARWKGYQKTRSK